MPAYWIEGVFISAASLKKSKKSGKISETDKELFARSIWAETPAEALRLADEALQGGKWLEKPRLSQTTEEQRMRQQGAPELPGLFAPDKKIKTPEKETRKKGKQGKR
jgi:hypothetical protein